MEENHPKDHTFCLDTDGLLELDSGNSSSIELMNEFQQLEYQQYSYDTFVWNNQPIPIQNEAKPSQQFEFQPSEPTWVPPVENESVEMSPSIAFNLQDDWKVKLKRNDILSVELMDIFASPEKDPNRALPRIDGILKNYLLRFFDLPNDFRFPAKMTRDRVLERIKQCTGRNVEPRLIEKLNDTLRRVQRGFLPSNKELFEGLEWDFNVVKQLPVYEEDQFPSE